MKRPSVLHAIDTLAVGGAERVLVDFANALAADGRTVAVCVTRTNTDTAGKLDKRIPLLVLQRTRTWDVGGFTRFKEFLHQYTIDVVHAHGYSTTTFVAAAKVLLGLNYRIVAHAHSSGEVPRQFRIALPWVDHILAVSEPVATKLQRIAPRTPVTLLENAVPTTRTILTPNFGWDVRWGPRRRHVGVVVANLRPLKDLGTIFRAVAGSRYRSSIQILVAGAESDWKYARDLKKLVVELGLGDDVSFLGRRDDISRVLGVADFGLFASTRETGPLALLEYMAANLPFVSTAVGAVGERCRDAGLPGFVQPGNVRGMSAAIDDLLSLSVEGRQARVRLARDVMATYFDFDRCVELLTDVYHHVGAAYAGRAEVAS